MNIFPDFAPGISPGDAPFIAHNQRVLSAAPPFMTVTRDALFGLAVAIPGGLSSGENFCRSWRITTPDGSQHTRAASGGLYRLDSGQWPPRGLLGRALRLGSRHRVLSGHPGEHMPGGMLFPRLARPREQGDPARAAETATFADSQPLSAFGKNIPAKIEPLRAAFTRPGRLIAPGYRAR